MSAFISAADAFNGEILLPAQLRPDCQGTANFVTILCDGYEQHEEEGILVQGGTSISVRDVLKLFLQSSAGIRESTILC